MSGACDVAWAAGLFEGEGCIAVLRFANRQSLCLTLTSSDHDVVDRFHGIVGCGTVLEKGRRENRPVHYKQLYEWRVSDRRYVTFILDLFWPWLGERRRTRATELLDGATEVLGRAERQRRQTHCVHGHEFTTDNTYMYRGARQCRACRNDRQRARRARWA